MFEHQTCLIYQLYDLLTFYMTFFHQALAFFKICRCIVMHGTVNINTINTKILGHRDTRHILGRLTPPKLPSVPIWRPSSFRTCYGSACFCPALSLGGPSSKGTFSVAKIPPCPSPKCPTHIHTPVALCTPTGCWTVGWEMVVVGGLCKCEARKGPAMVFLLCDGWLGGSTGLLYMRIEASRGENRGLFNKACHPKPPSHPTPSSSIPSSSSSRTLSLRLRLLLFLNFVAFICLSSLLLSHPIICTLPPLQCPFYLFPFHTLNFCSFRFPLLSIKLLLPHRVLQHLNRLIILWELQIKSYDVNFTVKALYTRSDVTYQVQMWVNRLCDGIFRLKMRSFC